MWAAVGPCWKRGEAAFDRSALERVLPAAAGSRAARSAVWAAVDTNGNGSVSLAEFDAWFRAASARYERLEIGGGETDDRSSVHAYARPCVMRAFFKASGGGGGGPQQQQQQQQKVGGGAKKTPADDKVVTRDEVRCLAHATQAALVVMRAWDARCGWDGIDRRVSWESWTASLEEVNVALATFGGTPLDDGDYLDDEDHPDGMLLDDALDGALRHVPPVVEEEEEEKQTSPPLKEERPAESLLRAVYNGVELTLRDVAGGTYNHTTSLAPLQLEIGGLVISVAPRRRPVSPPSEPSVSTARRKKQHADTATAAPCERCGLPRAGYLHSSTPADPERKLPPGWVKRWDKHTRRYVYVFSDRHTKTTTWIHPLTGVRPAVRGPFTRSSLNPT